MAELDADASGQAAAFRTALNHLAGERDGLLFQPLEVDDNHVLNAAVADLELKKLAVYQHISKDELSSACMAQLVCGLLRLDIFSSLQDVQAALAASCHRISQASQVLLPLFDRYQLHDRPLRVATAGDLLLLPNQFYDRRPRPPPSQCKKRRILIGYPSASEDFVAWKVYMVLVIADMIYTRYDAFETCRDTILDLARSFEPAASNFGPVLSIVWMDLFLRREVPPEWLTWEIIAETIKHYEFDTAIDLYAKISFLSPLNLRSYLAGQFLESIHAAEKEQMLQICQLLVPPNAAGRVLRELAAHPEIVEYSPEFAQDSHLPESFHYVLQPHHPIMFHIKRLLYQDCFDQAVSLSRQLGELDISSDDTVDKMFKLLFLHLLDKGELFYTQDQPVLDSLFYNFNLFAGDRGFRVFCCLYKALHDAVERPDLHDIKVYTQMSCRQTLLHLTAAKFPEDMVLEMYSSFMPVPRNVILESMNQQKAWMRNFLAIQRPPLPHRLTSASSNLPDFRLLYKVLTGERDVIVEEVDGAPVVTPDLLLTHVAENADDTMAREGASDNPMDIDEGSENESEDLGPSDAASAADGLGLAQRQAAEQEHFEEADSQSIVELSSDSSSEADDAASAASRDAQAVEHESVDGVSQEERQRSVMLEVHDLDTSTSGDEDDEDDNRSEHFFDAEPEHNEKYGDDGRSPGSDGGRSEGDVAKARTDQSDTDGNADLNRSGPSRDSSSRQAQDPQSQQSTRTGGYGSSSSEEESDEGGEPEAQAYEASTDDDEALARSETSREQAFSQGQNPQPLHAAGDEAYFAEESQVSEGEEELPRKEPKYQPMVDASMAGYDADATDNEERRRDDEGRSRRHRSGGYASSSIEPDGYDGGVSQGHTEEEDEDTGEAERAADNSEHPVRARRQDQYPLSDAMSAADEFTTEAEDSELDDREQQHVGFAVEIMSTTSQRSSSLHEHAVAAQDHFTTNAESRKRAEGESYAVANPSGDADDASRDSPAESVLSGRRSPDGATTATSGSEVPPSSAATHESGGALDEVAENAGSRRTRESSVSSPRTSRTGNDINVSSPTAPSSLSGTPSTRQGDTPSSSFRAREGQDLDILPPIFEDEAVETFDENDASQASRPGTPSVEHSSRDAASPTSPSSTRGAPAQETPLRRSARKRVVKVPYVGEDAEKQGVRRQCAVGNESETSTGKRSRRNSESSSRQSGDEAKATGAKKARASSRQSGGRQKKADAHESGDESDAAAVTERLDDLTSDTNKTPRARTTRSSLPASAKETTEGEGSDAKPRAKATPASRKVVVAPRSSARSSKSDNSTDNVDSQSLAKATPAAKKGPSSASASKAGLTASSGRGIRSAKGGKADEASSGLPPVAPRTARKAPVDPTTPAADSGLRRSTRVNRLSNASDASESAGKTPRSSLQSVASDTSGSRRSSRLASKKKDEGKEGASGNKSQGSQGKGPKRR